LLAIAYQPEFKFNDVAQIVNIDLDRRTSLDQHFRFINYPNAYHVGLAPGNTFPESTEERAIVTRGG
jgi:hypothetical protein